MRHLLIVATALFSLSPFACAKKANQVDRIEILEAQNKRLAMNMAKRDQMETENAYKQVTARATQSEKDYNDSLLAMEKKYGVSFKAGDIVQENGAIVWHTPPALPKPVEKK